MKNTKKLLALLLALAMVFALAACGNQPAAPASEPADEPAPGNDEPELAKFEEDDSTVYADALGEYFAVLKDAYDEIDNVSLRYAKEAVAEAKLLESAVYIPGSSKGGMFAIGRVAPSTVPFQYWGNDQERFYTALVVKGDPIKSEDRVEMRAKFAELKGTGEYYDWAKQFLADKGYELKDTYTIGYSSDPKTWDILETFRAADAEAIVNTFSNLYEYDNESVLQPALAVDFPEVSEDGLTYTIKLREGVKWVDSQGREVADVTANDWVTGLQHCLDTEGTAYLVQGVIKNVNAYIDGEITDFAEVGVKALDDYTIEYTLEQPTPYFLSMFTYNPFAPMNKAYFESKGGVLGRDAWAALESCDYGKDPDNIAYCGPYLVSNATASNKIVFTANPTYFDPDSVTIKTLTWLYNDGKDPTKAYNDMKAEVLDGCSLNSQTLQLAKDDGWFDKYQFVSATDATSYGMFMNLRRGGYALFNDETAVVSGLDDAQRALANAAMQNVHFRRAIAYGADRIAYNAQVTSDEVAALSVINSYTPGNFVRLEEDVTLDIGTFPAGTYYGAIMQAQLDADGMPIKVWDPEAEGGAGSSAGFDGWYNPDNAKAELALAAEELGIEISKENPVVLELVYPSEVVQYANRANAWKQSVEASTDGAIIIELLDTTSLMNWYYAGYYCESGAQCDYNMYDCSGWGPDYGDPKTYLDTLQDEVGDMIHMLGIY